MKRTGTYGGSGVHPKFEKGGAYKSSGESTYCSQCGSQYPNKMPRCPVCGASNWYSDASGDVNAQGYSEQYQPVYAAPKGKTVKCTNCGVKYPYSRESCPRCGEINEKLAYKKYSETHKNPETMKFITILRRAIGVISLEVYAYLIIVQAGIWDIQSIYLENSQDILPIAGIVATVFTILGIIEIIAARSFAASLISGIVYIATAFGLMMILGNISYMYMWSIPALVFGLIYLITAVIQK